MPKGDEPIRRPTHATPKPDHANEAVCESCGTATARRWRCCDCGGGGLTSTGDTCPLCGGAGFL